MLYYALAQLLYYQFPAVNDYILHDKNRLPYKWLSRINFDYSVTESDGQ
jgi:hypothetical protein